MFRFSPEQLVEAVGGRLVESPGTGWTTFEVNTDSRTVRPGCVFFALSGPRFDGHDFMTAVLEQPGTGVVGRLERVSALPPHVRAGHLVVGVADPLEALGDAAHYVRRRLDVPVVGLTGSMGKTTTKEMIARILEQTGPGLATRGNLNNLVGLPLMLLQAEPGHRWLVLEMGMNAPGEIARLQTIARPTVRLITNVAAAHTEGVGGIEGVARAKGELFTGARPGDTVVINLDDPRVAGLPVPAGVRRVTFGAAEGADVRLIHVRGRRDGTSDVLLALPDTTVEAHLPLVGVHQPRNALAAAAVAVALDVPAVAVVAGLSRLRALPMRMEPVPLPSGVLAINDAYNANPGSMEAALRTLVALRDGRSGGRACAILGDMLELGEDAQAAHRGVGAEAARVGVDRLFTFGELGRAIARGAVAAGLEPGRVAAFEDRGELVRAIGHWVRPGDVLLFKGSRGMQMERVLEALARGLESEAGQGVGGTVA